MSLVVNKVVNFPQPVLSFVPQDITSQESVEELFVSGGILSDLKHVWHTKGPCLEVRNIITGRKIGAWTFGCILKDSNTKIVCLDEIKRSNGRLPLLVIGIECSISGGLICVFDVFGSKVIRAIQIREHITSLHVVDYDSFKFPHNEGVLKYFDGMIAVGTQGGNVFLVDLCRQTCDEVLNNVNILSVRDELCPSQIFVLPPKDIPNIKKYIEKCVQRDDHLAIHLNVVLNSSTEHFTLKGEKGDDRVHVNKLEAEISCLYYSPQLNSLIIGYNFGAFQIWDLETLLLVYTSPICELHLPITKFAVQEPSDDPKAYCYVWVSYSNSDVYQSGAPFAVMYSLYYSNKKHIAGHGTIYKDFQYCSVRFQIELCKISDPNYGRLKGGCCISMQCVQKSPINKDLNSLALCLFAWSLRTNNSDISTFALVFDLNQWYKEQMPDVPNWHSCSNYIVKYSLEENLLDLKLDKKSINQFMGIQRLEEHFCPTSLSFDLWAVSENKTSKLHNESLQQVLLAQIENAGPLCLIKPLDFFERIFTLGLAPLFCDVTGNSHAATATQREVLLNVGLEQRLISWVCLCASEWANGSFSSAGLSIEFVISWAFKRAATLKSHCDEYCVSLFDYSGCKPDNNTIMVLNSCSRQIKDLCTVYGYIIKKLSGYLAFAEQIEQEQECLRNIAVYFEVLLWLVNVGVLPEYHVAEEDRNATNVPYLVHQLTEFYERRRAELNLDSAVRSDRFLYVDYLVEKCGAGVLGKQWQEDGGSGVYPPPSVQSMLRVYLMNGVALNDKNCLVAYVLLDVAMVLDGDKYGETVKHLLKFPQIFELDQSLVKVVHGFWNLDHGDFEAALENILDPCVQGDHLDKWHHSVVMRSLLIQKQYHYALLYIQIKKPPITDEKDILTVISLMVANGMLDEAFYFQKQHQKYNQQDLLCHLFNEFNRHDCLHALLYKYLDNDEEKTFLKYLQTTENPKADDLKVFYYLLRSRFIEAFDMHQNTKRKRPECQGLLGQRNSSITDHIVRMFKTLLPEVNRNVIDIIRKERSNLRKEMARPTPLSVFVHNAKEQVRYKSGVFLAAIAKAKETCDETFKDVTTDEVPFLRTPTVTKSLKKNSTPLVEVKTVELNESGEELQPSPSKKLKLTPRTSISSPYKPVFSHPKLETPIVKRKRSLDTSCASEMRTPQSILKTSFVASCNDDFGRNSSKTLFGISPRTPLKSHVKFDDLRYSSSFSDKSNVNTSGNADDDVFYSPNASPNEKEKKIVKEKEDGVVLESKTEEEEEEVRVKDEKIVKNDVMGVSQSPKARRSYKRSLDESPSIRSSPRLSRNKSSLNTTSTSSSSSSHPSSNDSPNVRTTTRRKSLSRAVLENNTFRNMSVPTLDDTKTKEISYTKTITETSFTQIKTYSDNSDFSMDSTNITQSFDVSAATEGDSFDLPLEEFLGKYIKPKENIVNEDAMETDNTEETPETPSKNKEEEVYEDKSRETEDQKEEEQLNEDKYSKAGETTEDLGKKEEEGPSKHKEEHHEDKSSEAEDTKEVLGKNEEENSFKQEEEHIYEDLSSGEEDVKEILRKSLNNNAEQPETNEENRLGDDVEEKVEESSASSINSEDTGDEKAFIADDVIEISSGDQESCNSSINQRIDSTESSSSSSESDYNNEDGSRLDVNYEDNLNVHVDTTQNVANEDMEDIYGGLSPQNEENVELELPLDEFRESNEAVLQIEGFEEVVTTSVEDKQENVSNEDQFVLQLLPSSEDESEAIKQTNFTEIVKEDQEEKQLEDDKEEKTASSSQKCEEDKEIQTTILYVNQDIDDDDDGDDDDEEIPSIDPKTVPITPKLEVKPVRRTYSKKLTEEGLIQTPELTVKGVRRTYSRRNTNTEEETIVEETSESKKAPEVASSSDVKPRRRSSRVSMLSESSNTESPIATPSGVRTRRSSQLDGTVDGRKKDDEKISPRKRTRSASVDQPVKTTKKRLTRSVSVDQTAEDGSKTKSKPVGDGLPTIQEENKAVEVVKTYATSRRLTRRQASILKGVEGEGDVSGILPDEDELNPIKLLDKPSFQGIPDPEEEKIYEQPSSPSGSTTSSRVTRRLSRSASVTSDTPSTIQVSTPKRRGRKPSDANLTATPNSGIKTRLRRTSVDAQSVVSEKSEESVTPPKRSKKKSSKEEEEEDVKSVVSVARSTRSTRSRADSESSIRSTDSKRSTRSKKTNFSKSLLPDISEEKNSETGSNKSSGSRKSTRK